jgi:hypothetical protein
MSHEANGAIPLQLRDHRLDPNAGTHEISFAGEKKDPGRIKDEEK